MTLQLLKFPSVFRDKGYGLTKVLEKLMADVTVDGEYKPMDTTSTTNLFTTLYISTRVLEDCSDPLATAFKMMSTLVI